MKNIRYCCEIFLGMISCARKKGISIIVTKKYNNLRFFLQCRNSDDIDTSFIAQQAILYCPWCGKNLDKVINKNKEALLELAEQHEDLIL